MHDGIVGHPNAFFEGWLDAYCHGDQSYGGSDADEFTYSCDDVSSHSSQSHALSPYQSSYSHGFAITQGHIPWNKGAQY